MVIDARVEIRAPRQREVGDPNLALEQERIEDALRGRLRDSKGDVRVRLELRRNEAGERALDRGERRVDVGAWKISATCEPGAAPSGAARWNASSLGTWKYLSFDFGVSNGGDTMSAIGGMLR